MREITSFDDIIDSRDVIERIEELVGERDGYAEDGILAANWTGSDDERELTSLLTLADHGERFVEDWEHGAQLIRYNYFTDHCRDLVQDVCGIPEGMADYIVIDWDATARNLQVDYSDVEFNGIVYFVR